MFSGLNGVTPAAVEGRLIDGEGAEEVDNAEAVAAEV